MRVALVIERFDPDAGGAERVAAKVAEGLVRAGDSVHVIARVAAPHARITPEVGFTLEEVRVPSGWQPLRVAAFAAAAARAAEESGADCVLSFARTHRQHVYRAGAGSHADYLAGRYGRLQRLARLSPRHAMLLAVERRIFRDSGQRILCNSELVRDQIAVRYGVAPERLAVLRNGVDLERFAPLDRAAKAEALRSEFGAQGAPVWLFAGSGFERKGLDLALRALARENARTRLWVAGRDASGPWRRRAARLGVAGRVEFLGFRRDLAPVYAAADALFLPTRYDAFANVCLEAAAAGLPVVTSGANGAAELFRAGGGVVEDPEDVAGFVRELKRLHDPDVRAQRGAAVRVIAERHGWQRHIRGLRDHLRQAVA